MSIRYLSGLTVDSTVLVVDAANDRVGIGTASPAGKLHIRGSAASITPSSVGNLLVLEDTENGISILSSTAGAGYLIFGDTADNDVGQIIYDHSANSMNFWANASERMRITSAGNVGIGNTAPNQKLELSVGNGVTGGLRINYAASGTSEGMDITYLNNGNTTTSFDSRYNSDSAVMQFRMKTAATAVNAMTILGSGNVGIGTTSPSTLLHLATTTESNIRIESGGAGGDQGSIYVQKSAGGGLTFAIENRDFIWRTGLAGLSGGGGTERMRITSGGNVVIGNTTAYGGLTVSDFSANDGNDSISLFYRGTAGNHESLIKFYDFRGQLNASLGNSLVNDGVGTQEARLVFSTSTGGSVTEKMRITGGGNVLINTTTDSGFKLDVSGTGRFTGVGFGSNGINALGANGGNGIYAVAGGSAGSGVYGFTNDLSSFSGTFEHTGAGVGVALRVIGYSTFSQAATFSSSVQSIGLLTTGNNGATTGQFIIESGANASSRRWKLLTSQNVNGDFVIQQSTTQTGSTFADILGFNATGAATFSSSVTATSFIKTSGTSSQYLMADGSVSTLTNPVTGTGTTNYVTKWTSGSAIGDSIIYDNGTNLGIGTTTPYGGTGVRSITVNAASYPTLALKVGDVFKGGIFGYSDHIDLYSEGYLNFETSGTEKMRIDTSGNLGIGTTSPNTKLQVSGSTSFYNGAAATGAIDSGQSETITTGFNLGPSESLDISTISLTSNTTWKAIVSGEYANNLEGGGLTSSSLEIELDSDFPTIDVGSTDITFSRNSVTGKLQVTNTNGTYRVTFVGSIRVLNYPQSGKPNVSKIMLKNVGIGTTAPSQASVGINKILDIGGATVPGIVLHSTNNASEMAIGTGGDGLIISASGSANAAADNIIRFFTSATNSSFAISEKIRITSTGNLLINTTTDSGYKLDVNGNTNVSGGTITAGSETTYAFRVLQGKPLTLGGDSNYAYIQSWSSGPLVINSQGNNVLFTNASTNVGIGTANPLARLNIWTPSATGQQVGLRLNNPFGFDNLNTGAKIVFSQDRSTAEDIPMGELGVGQGDAATSVNGYMYFSTKGSNTMGERMRITAAGNVGIGTTAPLSKLHVETSASNPFRMVRTGGSATNFGYEFGSGAIGLYDYTNSTYRYYITSGGDVGIGTTSPAQKLDVEGSVRATGGGFEPSTSAWINAAFTTKINGSPYGGGLALIDGTTGWAQYTIGSGANLVFAYGATSGATSEKMRITSAGNVGIGTTAPASKLTVDGASTGAIPLVDLLASGTGLYQRGVRILNSAMAANSSLMGFAVGRSDDTRNQGQMVFNFIGAGSTSNYLEFGLYGVDNVLNIAGTGFVGIGTTAPDAIFHVAKAVSSGIGGQIVIDNPSSSAVGNAVEISFLTDAGASGAGTRNARIIAENENAGNGAANMQFHTWSGAVSAERLRITSAGNVGIGTTAPVTNLHVSTTTSNDSVGNIQYENANTGTGAATNAQLIGKSKYGTLQYMVWESNGGRIGMRSTANSGAGNLYFTVGTDSVSTTMLANGNVGIGTTAPGGRLHIATPDPATNFVAIDFRNPTYGIYGKSNSIANRGNTLEFTATDYNTSGSVVTREVLTLRPEGNVGIGTTGPTEKLHVDGSALITYNNSFQSTNSVGNKAILARVSPTSGIVNYAEYATATNLNGFVIGSDDARVKGNITGDSLEFITNTSTRMTILSGGNVGINTTTPGSTLHVVGDVLIQTGALGVGVSPNATDGRIDASNDIVAFSTSDRRLKENITPIANALEKVRSLTGVEFDWKEETKSVHGYEGHDVGVIAQDVQAVLPEAVRTNDSGYLSVRYEKMIALLVEAMKEQQAQIDELKAQINDSPR